MTRARAAVALFGPALLAGCAYTVQRSGDPRFLERKLDWQAGVTSAQDVAAELGPPDQIRGAPGRLVFVYRYEREVKASLVLSAYLRIFTNERQRHDDSTLVAVFDDADRLLYYGASKEP